MTPRERAISLALSIADVVVTDVLAIRRSPAATRYHASHARERLVALDEQLARLAADPEQQEDAR